MNLRYRFPLGGEDFECIGMRKKYAQLPLLSGVVQAKGCERVVVPGFQDSLL